MVAPVQVSPDARRFGAVVVGSPLYGGRWLEAARSYVESAAGHLAARPTWTSSSGTVDALPSSPVACDEGWHVAGAIGSRGHTVFAGRLERRLLSADERRAPAGRAGDFGDWAVVAAWAAHIATAVGASRPVGVPA